MKILAHLGAFAALALSANAFAAVDYSKPNCTPDSCKVQITVAGAGCGGGITVSPDPITVKSGKGVIVEWNVAAPWSFAGPGIVINIPNDEFDAGGAKLSNTKKQAKIANKASKPGSYKYDIVLANDKDKTTCTLDPTILNY